MTIAVLSWALERARSGERVAIASVIQAKGSVPGKPGARLAIGSSGAKYGTVGGAGLELRVEKALGEILDHSINNNFLKEVMTEDVLEIYLKGKESIWNEYSKHISKFELNNWLNL